MKILYKCEKCGYETDRLLNYKRHEQRKTHCYMKLEDCVDKIVVPPNVNVVPPNVNTVLKGNNSLQCNRCYKVFSRKDKLKCHEKKCDGSHSLQCKVCLKVFTTRQGKNQHIQFVKCNPQSTKVINITNNINNINNINNTNNINNNTNCNNITNNNINIRVNFGEECLDKICQGEEYIRKANKFVDSGKYAIASSIEEIYFNDDSAENQTIKKNRRNDKLVSVMINGKWETRMFDDVCKIIMKTTEDYFNPFFIELQDKYDDIIQSKDGRKLMQLMAPIWRLATHITQHMGWNCKEIRKLGLNIDYDDDLDKDDLQRQTQRIKDVYTLILDKLHDKTLEIKCE